MIVSLSVQVGVFYCQCESILWIRQAPGIFDECWDDFRSAVQGGVFIWGCYDMVGESGLCVFLGRPWVGAIA